MKYIDKINQMAEDYEEEVLLLHRVIKQIQSDNAELTDFYLLKMVSLIYMSAEYGIIDLETYPEWENHVLDIYTQVAEKINKTNRKITLNKQQQANVIRKINAYKIKTLH
jgi:hypothetical protein